jgi:hypothetical protein
MKAILFPVILITALNCFSQSANVERTRLLAEQEKKNFNAVTNKQLLSLASDNFEVYYYRCNWNIDPAVRYISGSVTSYFKTTASTSSICL